MYSPYESKGERRVELWRRAIFLFDKSQHEKGPFYAADYKDFFCEPKTAEKLTPDIIAFADRFYCILDVSMSDQKGIEMKKYGNATLTEYLEDDTLLKSLNDWTGFVFPVPSYGILAVPESDEEELKPKLAGIFRKIAVDGEEMTSEGIIQLLMGDIYVSFSEKSRANLRKKVENICEDVSSGILKENAQYDPHKKSLKIIVDFSNPQSRAKFSRDIESWLKIVPLSFFVKEEEPLYDEFENDEEENNKD